MQAWAHSMVFPATPREVIDAKPDVVSHIGYFGYQAMAKRPQKYQEREKFPIDPAPFVQRRQQKHVDVVRPDERTKDHPRRHQLRLRNDQGKCKRAIRNTRRPRPFAHRNLPSTSPRKPTNGVLISAGTDSFAPWEEPYSALQGEVEILVRKSALTAMDAIRSATLISAMSMGQQSEMGTLETGKLANIPPHVESSEISAPSDKSRSP